MWLDDVLFASGREARPGRLRIDSGSARFVEGPVAAARYLALPGMVNAHDHLHLNAFPRLRFQRRYTNAVDWTRDMAAHMSSPAVADTRRISETARAWHGAFKNAVCGAVLTVHHDPVIAAFDDADFPISVVRPHGWAHSVPLGDPGWADDLGSAPRYGPPPGPSAATTPPGRPWFIHVAEGTDDRATAEFDALMRDGCIGPSARLVHGVGLGDRARTARAAGAALVWCPSANQFLLGAKAPIAEFLPGSWALGTDSRLTGGRDLLDEVSLVAAHADVTSADLVDALTLAGRRLIGAPSADSEALEDLVVVPMAGPSMAPFGNSREGTRLDLAIRRLAAARRGDVALVLAKRRPLVASEDFAHVFDEVGEPRVRVLIDRRTKWLAPRMLTAWGEAGIGERGVELVDGRGDWRAL